MKGLKQAVSSLIDAKVDRCRAIPMTAVDADAVGGDHTIWAVYTIDNGLGNNWVGMLPLDANLYSRYKPRTTAHDDASYPNYKDYLYSEYNELCEVARDGLLDTWSSLKEAQ